MAESTIHHYTSPLVGPLELHVSERGVRSVHFVSPDEPARYSPDHPVVARLIRELDAYFAGYLKRFSVPLDPDGGTDLQRRVWRELIRIPYGETRAYAEIAAAVGKPRAARAVGSANKRNRIPILIPCHRVVRADGGLGGYGSGIRIKKLLLKLEGVTQWEGDS